MAPKFLQRVLMFAAAATPLIVQVHYYGDGRPWSERASEGPDAEVPGGFYNLGRTGLRVELVAEAPTHLVVRYVFKDSADRNSKRMTSAGGGRRRPRERGPPRLGDPSSGPPEPRSGLGGGLASRSRPAGAVVRASWIGPDLTRCRRLRCAPRGGAPLRRCARPATHTESGSALVFLSVTHSSRDISRVDSGVRFPSTSPRSRTVCSAGSSSASAAHLLGANGNDTAAVRARARHRRCLVGSSWTNTPQLECTCITGRASRLGRRRAPGPSTHCHCRG